MTTTPITVSPDTTIRELKAKFEIHNFNMFPVVDARGLCCGVVTTLDLLRTFRLQLHRWILNFRLLWAERIEDLMEQLAELVGRLQASQGGA